jgi:phage tail-like protein
MVAAEAPQSGGALVLLPAGAPDLVTVRDEEHTAVPALTVKASAKVSAKASFSAGPGGVKVSAKVSAKASVSVATGSHKQHPSSSSPMPNDPDVAYAFRVNVNNTTYGMFSEISGLSWKAEPIPISEGGNNEYVTTMVGRGKFEPLVMKRGWFASSGEFMAMLMSSLTGGSTKREAVTIAVLNRKYDVIGEYNFERAYIVEYSGPSLNSMSGQIGFEQIRMSYDKFTYKPK